MTNIPESKEISQLPEPLKEIQPDKVLRTLEYCLVATAAGLGGAVAVNYLAEKLAQAFGN